MDAASGRLFDFSTEILEWRLRMTRLIRNVLAGLAVMLFTCALWGQQETGSIMGQVLDPSGAPVPGAQVAVKNQATTAIFNARSDAGGIYRAPQLPPGL